MWLRSPRSRRRSNGCRPDRWHQCPVEDGHQPGEDGDFVVGAVVHQSAELRRSQQRRDRWNAKSNDISQWLEFWCRYRTLIRNGIQTILVPFSLPTTGTITRGYISIEELSWQTILRHADYTPYLTYSCLFMMRASILKQSVRWRIATCGMPLYAMNMHPSRWPWMTLNCPLSAMLHESCEAHRPLHGKKET